MHKQLLSPVFATIMLVALLLISVIAVADEYLSPETIDGSTLIDAEALIKLAREKDDLVIIDARIRSDRRQGYIPDSVSLPDTETDCSSLFKVIYRKTTPVVFYCNGPRCQRSDNSVTLARDCGYSNIYWFRGGFEEWMNKKYVIHK